MNGQFGKLCLAMLALAFAGSAFAAQGQKSSESKMPTFEELDKNQNGGISRAEARAYPELEKIFSSVDADQDGELLAGEYRNATRKLKS